MSSHTIEPADNLSRVKGRHKRGDVVWPFRIRKILGGGAMGDVYLAEHITDGNWVALKFIPDKLRHNTVLAARFRREMKVLQELRHPSIVRCLSNLNDDSAKEYSYYAMEFVDGGTLEDLLRIRVRLTPEETFHYAVQILGALSAAHKYGVVHRDVKPSNLLISRDRRALKLCDFGLAMVLGGTQLTQPGQTIGTPWYMSPEQIRGEDAITGVSDLYAVGCILMEALTGKPPFVGDTHFSILNRHLTDEPPLVSSRIPDIANISFVDRFVSRLLEKDPARRPQRAGDLIAEIGSVFKFRPLTHAGTPHSRRPRPAAPTVSLDNRKLATARVSPGKMMRARAADLWQRIRTKKSAILMCILTASILANIVLLSSRASVPLSREEQSWIANISEASTTRRRAAPPFLALLGKTEPAAIDALEFLLYDSEPEVRRNALFGIARLRSQASRCRGRIQSLTRDESPLVREAAARVLRCLDGDLPPDSLIGFPE